MNITNYRPLNKYGLLVFKHKSQPNLLAQRTFKNNDRVLVTDESDGSKVVRDEKFSTFDLSEWTPLSQEEWDEVVKNRSYNVLAGVPMVNGQVHRTRLKAAILEIQRQILRSWADVSTEGLGGASVRCVFCGNEESDYLYVYENFKHKPKCALKLIREVLLSI